MVIIGYYHEKINEFEKNLVQSRTPVCFTCQTVINQILYRIRYLENQNHEIFKISFHYFPPCFNFDQYYGVENCGIIADGYEVQTKYLSKHTDLSLELAKIDRIILNVERQSDQVSFPIIYVRTKKNEFTTLIRDELIHRDTK